MLKCKFLCIRDFWGNSAQEKRWAITVRICWHIFSFPVGISLFSIWGLLWCLYKVNTLKKTVSALQIRLMMPSGRGHSKKLVFIVVKLQIARTSNCVELISLRCRSMCLLYLMSYTDILCWFKPLTNMYMILHFAV